MKTVVKFVMGDISKDSRDKREIKTLLDMGYRVVIVSSEVTIENDEVLKACRIINYMPLDLSYRQLRIARYLMIIRHWIDISRSLRRISADCISCHDIVALFIGWMSALALPKKRKPKLVYDSHELEAGRSSNRGELKKRFIVCTERFLIKRCAFSIVVNDSISDKVKELHHLKDKPIVVRNVPNYWEIDNDLCLEKHHEFCTTLDLPTDTFIAMYHGGIFKNRGIEDLLNSLRNVNDMAAVVLGDGDADYIRGLQQMAEDFNISQRVLFHSAVPNDILWKYVGAADLGIVLIKNTCLSYYLSLPNKLFENIQSGTPVLTSNFPELRRIVDKYGIGLCCDPEDMEEIIEKIKNIKNNKGQYLQLRKNVQEAKKELVWENERKILAEAYRKYIGDSNL